MKFYLTRAGKNNESVSLSSIYMKHIVYGIKMCYSSSADHFNQHSVFCLFILDYLQNGIEDNLEFFVFPRDFPHRDLSRCH